MKLVLVFFIIQGILGAFDFIYHYEFKERLAWKPSAKKELFIHSLQSFFYGIIFLSLAWLQWHGSLALVFASIFLLEILLTLWDFISEDHRRTMPSSQCVTHTILTLNSGVILALFFPELLLWLKQPTGFIWVNYSVLSGLMTLLSVGLFFGSIRKLSAAFKCCAAILPEIRLTQHHMKFLVTGGSGFIGSRLCQMLINAGHDVTILTRNKQRTVARFKGRITLINSLKQAEDGYHVIINLAGESLSNGRWTKAKKKKICDSRLIMTQELIDYIAQTPNKPDLLLNGSAIGFYGSHETEAFTETSVAVTKDFAQALCEEWEKIALQAKEYNVRVCTLRIGLVLGLEGGALSQMLCPFEFGLGGKMGSGEQWMSWIHIDDLIGLMAHIINTQSIEGALNGTAPNPVKNKDFVLALGKTMRRPTLLTMPAFNLQLLLGEFANVILLKGQKVLPKKALDTGYMFKYEHLSSALDNILKNR